MNPSEIAERAARDVLANCALHFVKPDTFSDKPQEVINHSIGNAAEIILRAIEESRGQPPDLGIADVWHKGTKSYYRAKLLKKLTLEEALFDPTGPPDGETSSAPPAAPKPKVGGVYTGLRDGCTAHPSGLCECGVEESHKLCVCANCGSTWSNPELRSGAAQEVSPEHILRNLLAVIHRDGGHYAAEHGLEKAGEDAEALVLKERVEEVSPAK